MSETELNDQMSRLKAKGIMGLSQVEDIMVSLFNPKLLIVSPNGEFIPLSEKRRQLLLKKATAALGMLNVFINAYLSTEEELSDRCGDEDICIYWINGRASECEECRRRG